MTRAHDDLLAQMQKPYAEVFRNHHNTWTYVAGVYVAETASWITIRGRARLLREAEAMATRAKKAVGAARAALKRKAM